MILDRVRKVLSRNPILAARGWDKVEARFIVREAKSEDEALEFAKRRSLGEPLQYVLGNQIFLGHVIEVGPGVLVPRPETEFLVETSLSRIKSSRQLPAAGAEIGAGSGAISISLVSELVRRNPAFRMVATEVSAQAIQISERNLKASLGDFSQNVEIRPVMSAKQVLEPFGGETFDFLISNPPYLQEGDPIDEDVLQHEPASALFAPDGDGLYFYRAISARGMSVLNPGGFVFCEIPSFRSWEIKELFQLNGWQVEILKDLAGEDRVLVATHG